MGVGVGLETPPAKSRHSARPTDTGANGVTRTQRVAPPAPTVEAYLLATSAFVCWQTQPDICSNYDQAISSNLETPCCALGKVNSSTPFS